MPYRNLVSLLLSRAESHGRHAYCIRNARGERILLQGPSHPGRALHGRDINVTVNAGGFLAGYSTIASEIISSAVSSAFETMFCVGRMAK